MAGEPPRKKRTVDPDGVVRVTRERASVAPAFLLGALAVVVGGALFLVFHRGPSSASPERAPAPRPVTRRAQPPRALPEPPLPEAQRPKPTRAAATPEPARALAQEVDMPSEPADEHHGIGLFHAGTKPIKVGIIVPEGFELPPGYVRHFQTTDDGQMLPPILMFHPDHPPVDAQGKPIAVTADRIVPPELAPPGMPIQMLEPPKPSGDEDSRP